MVSGQIDIYICYAHCHWDLCWAMGLVQSMQYQSGMHVKGGILQYVPSER